MLRDAEQWWGCINAHDKLIEVIRYREGVCDKFKADAAKPEKRWWE
jgi:hypothetical protein